MHTAFTIGTAGATTSLRLGRHGEAFVSYYLNRYRFPRYRLLELGVTPNVARNTAMVGVTLQAGSVLR